MATYEFDLLCLSRFLPTCLLPFLQSCLYSRGHCKLTQSLVIYRNEIYFAWDYFATGLQATIMLLWYWSNSVVMKSEIPCIFSAWGSREGTLLHSILLFHTLLHSHWLLYFITHQLVLVSPYCRLGPRLAASPRTCGSWSTATSPRWCPRWPRGSRRGGTRPG